MTWIFAFLICMPNGDCYVDRVKDMTYTKIEECAAKIKANPFYPEVTSERGVMVMPLCLEQ